MQLWIRNKTKKCCESPSALSEKRKRDHEQLMERLRENAARREAEDIERKKNGIPKRRPPLPLMAFMAASMGVNPSALKYIK